MDGVPLGERNPKWLQDDYVKFIRFAQWRIDKTGEGVVAFITNHGYLDNPTFRFFTRDVGGNGKANLRVDVLYEDFDGHVKHLTIAKLKTGSEWQPTIIVPIYMNVLAAASPSGVTAVAFQFKAEGLQKDETLSISSFYVDPYCSR